MVHCHFARTTYWPIKAANTSLWRSGHSAAQTYSIMCSNPLQVLQQPQAFPPRMKRFKVVALFSGFFNDPDDIPGLAHFCEHMLFLGTEKYKNENDYNKYLNEHGGSSNAATYPDHTIYYFDIVPEHLRGALDR